jgi:hypothetical protein
MSIFIRNSSRWLFYVILGAVLGACVNSKRIEDLQGTNGPFAFSNTSTTLPTSYKGQIYTYNFGTNNGVAPVKYVIASGSVPGGLSLSSIGVLTGPVTGSLGSYNFTVTATDASGSTVSQSYSLDVSLPFSLLTTSLPNAIVNTAYVAALTASGGFAPYTYSATGLPTGISLGSSTGLITGTPTVLGKLVSEMGSSAF